MWAWVAEPPRAVTGPAAPADAQADPARRPDRRDAADMIWRLQPELIERLVWLFSSGPLDNQPRTIPRMPPTWHSPERARSERRRYGGHRHHEQTGGTP
ncbi:MAG: hypothetical protein QOJ50_3474 [Cryptosporangiaceae bacterium]|jgi:hypothetical protein|nr:hypothetical protein [Cryptosporangiaceae bacterium]